MANYWAITLLLGIWLLVVNFSVDGASLGPQNSRHKRRAILIKKDSIDKNDRNGTSNGSQASEAYAEPCDDFYASVCGNWLNKDYVSSITMATNHYAGGQFYINHALKSILELRTDFWYMNYERFRNPEPLYPEAFRSTKNVYRACMNQTLPDETPLEWFLQVIKGMGPWPMVDDNEWDDSQFDLTALISAALQQRGISGFVEIDPFATREDPFFFRIRITPAQNPLAFGRSLVDVYENVDEYIEKIDNYKEYLRQMVTYFKEDLSIRSVDNETIKSEVDDLIELERTIAQLSSLDLGDTLHDRFQHPRLSDMNRLMPVIEWERLLLTIVPSSIHPYIRANPFIIIEEPGLLSELSALISRSDPRTIANYIMVHYVKKRVHQLGPKYAKLTQLHQVSGIDFVYDEAEEGKQDPEKWQQCLKTTEGFMQNAIGAMYAREYQSKEGFEKVRQIFHDIKAAFGELLKESEFLDEATRQKALKKLAYLKVKIGYPDFVFNDERIDEYYKGANIDSSMNFLQIQEILHRWEFRKSLEAVIQQRDRGVWFERHLDTNAYYMPTLNSMTILAGILTYPFFFEGDIPWAYNFGALGQTIGHEIGHAFDSNGFTYDHVGRHKGEYTNETKAALDKKYACMIDQYESIEIADAEYQVNGTKLNGKSTLNENLADNDGIKAAFRGYQIFLKRNNGVDKPFGNFTREQTFFIAYAMQECEVKKMNELLWQIARDPHALSFARVNIPLMNMPEFAKAWNCPVGSKMNPVKTCSMWGKDEKKGGEKVPAKNSTQPATKP